MTLPTFLPLPEAAEKFGLTEAELRTRVEAGTIAAGKLPDGEIVVSETNMNGNGETNLNERLSSIKREDFEHLQGQPITVTEAAKKYGVSRVTIFRWTKSTYVDVVNPGYGMELDESDVAYCATIHAIRKQSGIRTGFPLLDSNGLPNLLKHPNLSRYRREQSAS